MAGHFKAAKQHRPLILSGDVHNSKLLSLMLREDDNITKRVFGHEVVSSALAQKLFGKEGINGKKYQLPQGEDWVLQEDKLADNWNMLAK